MKPTQTRVAMLLKATAPNKPLTPAERNAKAKKELIESEQALSKKDGTKRRRFMAVYRLSETRPSTKGSYAERRDHLIARFEGLASVKHHVATSSWSLRSYQATKGLVLAALKPAIDETIDFLEVVETSEPVHVGDSNLKS